MTSTTDSAALDAAFEQATSAPEGASQEVVPASSQPSTAVAKANPATVWEEEMEGTEEIRFPKVKVPGSGGTAWEVPGDEPDDFDHVKEIVGVVVDDYSIDSFYVDEYDGGNEPPDALWIAGDFVEANERAIEAGVIPGVKAKDQPLNKFGTGRGGKGKAISNRWRLFVMRSGEMIPTQVDVPVMSRRNWTDFKQMRIVGRGHRVPEVVVRMGLKRETSSGGVPYAQIVFGIAQVLPPEQAAFYLQQREAMRPFTRAVGFEPEEVEIVAEESAPARADDAVY